VVMSSLPYPTESQEGEMLVAYLRISGYKFTHIGNESNGGNKQAMIRGAKMKRQGQSPGFPDYCIIVNNVLIFIELKRAKKSLSRVAPEQREWLTALASTGAECAICYGASEAIEFIESLEHTNNIDLRKKHFPSQVLSLPTPDTIFLIAG
jgi:hypothetical protein